MTKCPKCGDPLVQPGPPAVAQQPEQQPFSLDRVIGLFLSVAGISGTLYFFLLFDPSVPTAIGRINNIGLLADRQNGIIVSIAVAVFGLAVLVYNSMTANTRTCPKCAERIQQAAVKCRFCGEELDQ